jgi:hypothetical protein
MSRPPVVVRDPDETAPETEAEEAVIPPDTDKEPRPDMAPVVIEPMVAVFAETSPEDFRFAP